MIDPNAKAYAANLARNAVFQAQIEVELDILHERVKAGELEGPRGCPKGLILVPVYIERIRNGQD